MEYKRIEPDVLVGMGDKTIFAEKKPPFLTVAKLHIQLEHWFGDDLMECYPCYIVTARLKEDLEEKKHFTGFEFDDVKVTKDTYFDDNYDLDIPVPKLYWLKVIGEEDKDDLYVSDCELFISDKMLAYLKKNFAINYLEVEPDNSELDDFIDEMIIERLKEEGREEEAKKIEQEKLERLGKVEKNKTA